MFHVEEYGKRGVKMDMNDVIALVNTNRGNGRKHNLNRMYALLKKLGDPQKRTKFIHISGTNGKGSTSSFLMSILETAGYRTGLFTSPHLEKINERIRINDVLISDEEFISLTEQVQPAVLEVEEEMKESLYAFEILTAIAFLYFSIQRCDLVLLEVGIGGRLDATNTIEESLVSVITSIGLDHVGVLGNTLEKIAGEKVGILKNKGDLVTFDAPQKLETIFIQACIDKHAQYHKVNETFLHVVSSTAEKQLFHYKKYTNLVIHMMGYHQVQNAILAIEVTSILKEKSFSISNQDVKRGLEEAFWPGRWEQISEKPLAFLDGAHNQPATEALIETIQRSFPNKKVTFVLGMMEDKDYQKMLDTVLPIADKVLTLSPESERAIEGSKMSTLLKKRGYDAVPLTTAKEVLDYIYHEASNEELIVVFGSLYLVGNIKKEINTCFSNK